MAGECLSGLKKIKWRDGLIANALRVPNYISIIGPTASGKSKLAMDLALEFNAEIVNCDSVQIYKGFCIGAAKASLEEQEKVKHHLLDVLNWNQDFDAAMFAKQAQEIIGDIAFRKKLPIVVGGSGLYLRSLWGEAFHDIPSDAGLKQELNKRDHLSLYQELERKDPQRAAQIHPNDKFRCVRALEINTLTGQTVAEFLKHTTSPAKFPPALVIMMQPERERLKVKIHQRVIQMLKAGLVSEVKDLLHLGCPKHVKPMQSIGYKQVVDFLDGKIKEEDLVQKISWATSQYAKRQFVWYKKVDADIKIEHPNDIETVRGKIKNLL